jgi:tetratricopeptide (TPR) repeat protein
MKLITSSAFALVAAAWAVPASAQYNNSDPRQPMAEQQAPAQQQPGATQQAAPSVKPSSKAVKAIIDLQTAVNNKDVANIPAKLAAAQAVATTKEDHYLIASLQLKAALAANDDAAMAAAIDAIASSNYLDSAKLAGLYSSLGGTLLNAKQYAQAAAAYRKAIAIDPRDSEAQRLLGISYYEAGQKGEAVAALQKAIGAIAAAGQKPSEDMYKLAVQAAFDTRSPAATDLARQWLAAYPSPESWRDTVAVYRGLNQPDTESTLDLMRLLQAAGALKEADDYAVFIVDAADQNNYNEAQQVLDAGIAAKVIDPSSKDFRDIVAALKTKPKATAADLAEATKTAANGTALLHIGDRYYAMGNYAKAVELYKMAMGKPGVDASVDNLHVGMALARSGDKAGATAALNAVTGARADVAKLWLAYVNQKA